MSNDTSLEDALPKAPGPRLHSLQTDPDGIRNLDGSVRRVLGESYSGDRNIYKALGYVINPKFEHFKARYKRNDTAKALVDKPAKDCWGEEPQIRDNAREAGEEAQTTFEEQVETFLEGEYTRKSPVDRLMSADRMSRLGEYSVILLGLSDAGVESGDPGDLRNEVEEDSLDTDDPDEVLQYLHVYDQSDAPSNQITYVQDPTDSRFGLPEQYRIDFGHSAHTVHHSRIVHIVEDAVTDDLHSDPVLLRSINRIDDLEKILGGSAEAFWRAAYQGLIVKPPENLPSGTSAQDVGENLEKQIKNYRHNLNREIFSSGDIDTLDTTVSNPEPHLDGQYSEIAAGHDIPQSMLRGNETGERATQEDRQMYHEYLAKRRRQHCESAMLRPLIDRLIEYGVFEPPEGEGYEVEWPALDELGQIEEADLQHTEADTLKILSGGMPRDIASVGELRKVKGWDAEIGSEVDEEDRPDEQALAEQEQGQGESESETETEEVAIETEPVEAENPETLRANVFPDDSDPELRAAADALEQFDATGDD